MKKPVLVTITKTKHKTQPYVLSIDKPGKGPDLTNRERYADKRGARRGALRALDARTYPRLYSGKPWFFNSDHSWVTPEGRAIKFKYLGC